MNALTAFQRDILTVLAGADGPKGLRIKELLEDYYGEEVNHGRLYPNLDDLVERGLIRKDVRDRRTNEYFLTDRGREALLDRRSWENEHGVNDLAAAAAPGEPEEVDADD